MSSKKLSTKRQKPMNTFLTTDQDEDLRKSLAPLQFGDNRSYSFTKFVKFKADRPRNSTNLLPQSNTRIKFTSAED